MVTREVQLDNGSARRNVYVIHRSYQDRVMTKNKARRLSMVKVSKMAHIRTGGTHIHMNTDKDVHRQNGRYRTDAHTHIAIAKNMAQYMNEGSGRAKLVFGSPRLAPMSQVSAPAPLMIIERPDGVKPRKKKDTGPTVASAK